jgi:predicted kinase
METPPVLVLVTGLPGTGKTSVADVAARELSAAVLAHDWAMSALRPYPEMQRLLDNMEPSGHRVVGWSILTSLAQSQLRAGRSVVLDGVARAPEIARCRELAREEAAAFVLLTTHCLDVAVHQSRLEGRQRHIPNWYELSWDQVQRSSASWNTPEDCDLLLDASNQWVENVAKVVDLLAGFSPKE